MAIWLHPSVTSTIVDNSGFYATADGVTTAFFPGFFQKGKDNELIAVDGPTDADLVKKFGKIDAVEYGQNHLNLVNWLVAGGSAIVMRCLPDNAKYAHAILEVLTKSVTVKATLFAPKDTDTYGAGPYEVQRDYDVDGVFTGLFFVNADGEKVVLCDAKNADKVLKIEALETGETVENLLKVEGTISYDEEVSKTSVVPKITYVPSGVSKKETIEAYIMNKHASYDSKGTLLNPDGNGYARHILGYFIPEGRGASFYNDVRISISLTNNYDNSYDFRVYSLRFEAYDAENEEWGIIYGPFYVSFDETSRDFSDETMFIADILDKYCEEFTFVPYGANADEESGLYNAGFYSAAKAIAGNEVSPRRVDVLSGQEYFNEAEESFSNIHKDVLLNGGTYVLRKDVTTDDIKSTTVEVPSEVEGGQPTTTTVSETTIYVDGKNLPIPGSVAIINSKEYTIKSVDSSSAAIVLDGAVTERAYTEEELKIIDDEDNKAEAAKICILKDSALVYINDVAEPNCEASVKSNDRAIERITGKEYKLYLNKNGADFYKGQEVSITLSNVTQKGDDPKTEEEETSFTYSDKIELKATIKDIVDIDDAIVVEFDTEKMTEDAKAIVSKFDKYDSAKNLEEGVLNDLSDGYSADIEVTAVALPVSPYSKYLTLSESDYAYMQFGSAGDSDTVDGASRADVAAARKSLLVKAFRGTLNPAITMKKFWPFDIVLDANYDAAVKNAINELTTSREDFMFLCDTGFCATPEQAIDKRNGSLTYNNRYTAIFTQDMRVYDEYTGKNLKVTPTYFLAKKIPYVDRAFGIHYAFVGPQRGEIEGMLEGTLSWNPTEQQKEKLYKKQLNYIQHDPNHLMFMGQLTSQKRATSLSDIPNVRALLKIRREIENICEEYYFERINGTLLGAMSSACNNYLGNWVANGTLSEGNVSVYASEYDMKQKLVRVQVELKFTSFLERVVITFTVK
jgi:hypothetical protein